MTKIMDMSKLIKAAKDKGLSEEEFRALLPLMIEAQDEINKKRMKGVKSVTGKAKGGDINKQMEMFQDGGLKDEGGTKDPVSGNDVPPGATQEEVRDDIPAQLSEGEFVFPADVVRYIGLEKLMRLRQEAKMGLKMMEDMGQMGNADEATIPDDIPFSVIDINIAEDDDEVEKRAEGGVIEAANGFAGTTTATNPLQQRQPNVTGTQTGVRAPYIAPAISTATVAPTDGFRYKSPIDTTKKATYTGLFGGEDLTQGPDEYKTYVNDAGAEIQIPFKNGKLLTGFTIPEGYTLKTEEVGSARVGTTKVKRVKEKFEPQEMGGDYLADNEYSVLGGARTNIGGKEYAIEYNIFNPDEVKVQSVDSYYATGRRNFQTVTPEVRDLIYDQLKGQTVQLGYMVKPQAPVAIELAKKLGIEIPGSVRMNELIKASVDATEKLNNKTNEEDIFGRQIGERKETKTFDSLTRAQQRAIQEGRDRNIGLSDKFIKDLDIEKAARKGRKALDTSPIGTFTAKEGTAETLDQPDLTTEAGRASTYAPQEQQDEAGDQGFGEGFGESGFGQSAGSFGGIGDFKQGGLAKKKVKPKKMKRGGLASKK